MQYADYCLTIIGKNEEIDIIHEKLGGIASCENLRALTETTEGYTWFCSVASPDEEIEYSMRHLTGGKSEITVMMDSFQHASWYDDLVLLTKKFPSLTIYCNYDECETDGTVYATVYENERITSQYEFDWHALRIIPNLLMMQSQDSTSANEIAMLEFREWANRLIHHLEVSDSLMEEIVRCRELNVHRGELRDLLSWAFIFYAFPEGEWQTALKIYPTEFRLMAKKFDDLLRFTENLDEVIERYDEDELEEFEETGWEITEEGVNSCKAFLKRLKKKEISAIKPVVLACG